MMHSASVSLCVAFLVVAVASCEQTVYQDADLQQTHELTTASEKRWGVYQIYWRSDQFAKGLERQRRSLGADPQYILFFRDIAATRGFPTAAIDLCRQRGAIPVISLELHEWGQRASALASQSVLSDIISGVHDDFFKDWAKQARVDGQEIHLRFGFEMNGDWFAWGQQPTAYIAAWKHAHQIFTDAGVVNVKWMWSVNVLYGDLTEATGIDAYWPGADVVDSIGIDGYNFGDNHDQWHHWQSYDEVFARTIDAVHRFAKPIIISEIACANDARKSQWSQDFLRKFSADARLSAFIWFNFNKTGEAEQDWRINSDPETLDIFREYVAGGDD